MSRAQYSVAMTDEVDRQARSHLIRADGQEDLCFGLWRPSRGARRLTALLYRVILPKPGDRQVHGNASFNAQYLERALSEAAAEGAGLAFLHSHPHPGWQDMSPDDIAAESNNAGAVFGATGRSFVGLTVGTDGAWSARFWQRTAPRKYERAWCATVRVVGEQLRISYMDQLAPRPSYRQELRRTVSAWGAKAQAHLARVHVGIVGAGSVGDLIAEAICRTGMEDVTAIDFDSIEKHNLDRLSHATRRDVGRLKVDVLEETLPTHATAERFCFSPVAFGINDEEGFREALDCDMLFSCVDRPWPRHILNFISAVHLIPVVDGGISVRTNRSGRLAAADWRAHISAPGRACLQCLGQYDPGLVEADRRGLLDDPKYINGLPSDHPVRQNENVFGFSMGCASQQFLQMLAFVIAPLGQCNLGAQLYHFVGGFLEPSSYPVCHPECLFREMTAHGEDARFSVTGPRTSVPKVRDPADGRSEGRPRWATWTACATRVVTRVLCRYKRSGSKVERQL